MANEYFKVKQIWKQFRKGLRQYPFSMCDFVTANPGSNDTLIGSGIVPDGASIYERTPLSDEHDTPEVSVSDHIDPPFIYDESVSTGLKENV